MVQTPFTHLHVHSEYSLLDGAVSVADLVAEAARAEMPALALTDHGNLFGAIEFYTKARKAGINPILGCEAYLVNGDASVRLPPGSKRPRFHVTLLATSRTGYENLARLSSKSWLHGFQRKPCMDKTMLAEHHEGLIALSGCLSGEVARHLLADDVDAAVGAAHEYADIFGRDGVYLELMDNGLEPQSRVRARMDEVARRTGLKTVATNDVHYRCYGDHVTQDALICIGTGQRMHDPARRFRIETDELFFRTSDQMAALFGEDSQAYRSTHEIAQRCDIRLDLDTMHLPRFEIPTDETPEQYLRRLCLEGLRRKYGEVTEAVRARFEKEITVIESMGFVSYFLIVWDLIRFGRESGIPVGPGRGSAAGSIVAYALDITQLDPLRYDLLFERFLNADRISMPDIDIDFCRDRRDDVIRYTREKYGHDNVCQIVTFGRMAAKAAMRDAGRVLDVPLPDVDRIAKRIPVGPKVKLADSIEGDAELDRMLKADPRLEQLTDVGLRIEGFARHASTHAAGVVITDEPLIDLVPLCVVQGETNTQYQMSDLERIGLLKMDFLGLKNLTILDSVARIVRQTHGVEIDYDALPLDDAPTYELLKRADCGGVFQLESAGMRELIHKLQPDCFEDIIALIALYRPGPLKSGMVDNFVRRKHGLEPIEYIHEAMEPVLRDTYGVIVYQEQVMRLAHELGGLSLNDADGMRKAMGKKQLDRMVSYRDKFLAGSGERGIPRVDAERIWELMALFAEYGFNKSHSAAYGLITFRTAYMKAHYPGEFMAALMSCDAGNSDKLAEYHDEALRNERPVLGPDVNASRADFSLEDGAIRWGLSAIKGVGERAVAALLEARERRGGRFESLADLIDELDTTVINRACFDALVRSGALDGLEPNRHALLASSERLLRDAARANADRLAGQANLFAGAGAPSAVAPLALQLEDAAPPTEHDVIRLEKESLGLCVTVDPLRRYRPVLKLVSSHELHELRDVADRSEAVVGGIVGGLRTMVSSRGRSAGRSMATFRVSSSGTGCAAVVFPDTYERCRELLVDDAVLVFRGKVDKTRDEPSLLVDEVYEPTDPRVAARRRLVLDLRGLATEEAHAALDRLRDILARHGGPTATYLALDRGEHWTGVRLADAFSVGVTVDAALDLQECLAPNRVHLR